MVVYCVVVYCVVAVPDLHSKQMVVGPPGKLLDMMMNKVWNLLARVKSHNVVSYFFTY